MKRFLVVLLTLALYQFLVSADFKIGLADSYGDGWNGGTVSVLVNNQTILDEITLADGAGPEFHTFSVETGDVVEIDYTAGDFSNENSYVVLNNIDLIVVESGSAPTLPPEDSQFVAEVVSASYGTISGSITDSSGEPLDDAEVTIYNDMINYTIFSNQSGAYTQEVLSSVGSYLVSCRKDGYLTNFVDDVVVNEGEDTIVDFLLEPVSEGDDIGSPIVVTQGSYQHFGNSFDYSDYYEIGLEPINSIQNSKDVIYSFTLDQFKTVSISLEGSEFDTQIAIFSENSYPTFNTHLYYNDDFNFAKGEPVSTKTRSREEKSKDNYKQSAIMDRNYPPGKYYVVVDGVFGGGGNYSITIDIEDYHASSISEDFEFGVLPQSWTVHNLATGSEKWEVQTLQFDAPSYSGEYIVHLKNYNTIADDWLITPKLKPTENNKIISFGHRGVSNYFTEKYSFSISTTGTEVDDFTVVEDVVATTRDWQTYTLDLSQYIGEEIYFGIHCYSGGGEGFGVDLDSFSMPILYPEVDLALINCEMDYAPVVGVESKLRAIVKNYGEDISTYNIKLFDEVGVELATVISENLPSNEFQVVELNWTPLEAGERMVYVEVAIENDCNPDNNKSDIENIVVYNEGMSSLTIGTETIYGINENYFPIMKDLPNSITETIYPASYFEGSGTITAIGYHQNFVESVNELPVVIRVGEVEQSSLEDGVVLAGDLEIVFEGELSFSEGSKVKMIEFQNAYNYMGGNLVVMVEKQVSFNYSHENNFYLSSSIDGSILSVAVGSIDTPLDPYQSNEDYLPFTYYPNTTFIITYGEGGSLSGSVTDSSSQPIEGAEVTLVNDQFTFGYQTDSNGSFLGENIPFGEYTLEVEAFGYSNYTQVGTVIDETPTNLDIVLDELPVVTLTANIYGEDAPTVGLEGVAVLVEGYGVYDTTTNSSGQFLIDNLYANNEYNLTIVGNRYKTYSSSIIVENNNVDLGDIVLEELFLPVTDLSAEVSTSNVNIEWRKSESGIEQLFQYDDGIAITGLGYTNQENQIFGTVFNYSAQINELKWFLRDYHMHTQARLLILGLDSENGNRPDSDNILYDSGMIPNIDEQWNTHILDLPIIVENGFFFGVMTPGISVDIGVDDGVGERYQFVEGVHYSNSDLDSPNGWTLYEDSVNEFRLNNLLRVEGLNLTEEAKFSDSKKQLSSSTTTITSEFERVVNGYTVYRLDLEDQNNQNNWTELSNNQQEDSFIDVEWSTLSDGVYIYGVKSLYNNGESVVNFSNIVPKGMTTQVTFNVSIAEGGACEDAEITLVGEEFTYTGVTDQNGEFQFDEIWLGTYSLKVKKDGLSLYYDSSVPIYSEENIDITLLDIPLHPENIIAESNAGTNDINISWDAPVVEFENLRYDDDEMSGGVSLQSSENSVLGTIFRNKFYLTSVSWMTVPSASHTNVKIIVLGLDENQIPDQNIILYQSDFTSNTNLEWCSYDFEETIYAPNGFYVGILTPNESLGIAFDDGIGNYPFQQNTFVGCMDWTDGTNDWIFIDSNFPNNLFIRATGINYGELERKALTAFNSGQSLFSEYNGLNSGDKVERTESPKALISYKVYRLLATDQQNPENWEMVVESTTETSVVDQNNNNIDDYIYAVQARYSGNLYSIPGFSGTVDLEDNLPINWSLKQNYPNPFNPETTINYSVANGFNDLVKVVIYNVKGELVSTLVNSVHTSGNYSVKFNGSPFTSGVYYYSIESNKFRSIKKMLLVK